MSTSQNKVIDNVDNPKPILLQQKSKINTNPFIPDSQKQIELQAVQDNANNIVTEYYNKNMTSSIQNLSLSEINKNIGKSIMGLMNDLLNKPNNIDWLTYVQLSLKKDNRYTYIGIVFVVIAVYIILTNQ